MLKSWWKLVIAEQDTRAKERLFKESRDATLDTRKDPCPGSTSTGQQGRSGMRRAQHLDMFVWASDRSTVNGSSLMHA